MHRQAEQGRVGKQAGYWLHTKQTLGFPPTHTTTLSAVVNGMGMLSYVLLASAKLFQSFCPANILPLDADATFSSRAEKKKDVDGQICCLLVADICHVEMFAAAFAFAPPGHAPRYVAALCIPVPCLCIGHLLSFGPKKLWPGQP